VPRKRSDERALNTWVSPSFSGTVERVASAEGLSKSALVRRALVAYMLPPDGDDA
jgi:hypothetical protein